jgi:A118 family predicted phage portal protein
MPLPEGGSDVQWPPRAHAECIDQMHAWGAWYSGNTDALRSVYAPGRSGLAVPKVRPSQLRGGAVGTVARWFWGQPPVPGQQSSQLHLPVAAELCEASANLLFSEPPKVLADDQGGTEVQEQLEMFGQDGLHSVLAEAAEVAAAHGGVYLRAMWDEELSSIPFTVVEHSTGALPEFRHGRLVAVTLWWELPTGDSNAVMRHVERHENDNGRGVIRHGLYVGDKHQLGRAVPLTEHPDLENVVRVLQSHGSGDGQTIDTGSPELAVTYVPSQRPARRWVDHPVGRHLGRSDLDGVEPFLDALDEVYTSWMRDIRLGKARILVPQYLLDSAGPGRGYSFDLEREVYHPLNMAPDGSQDAITPVQFAIRVQEHRDTAQHLLEAIYRTAGYSSQTFGEGDTASAVTATEVHSRERRSFMTRDRKSRYWRPAVARHLRKMLYTTQAMGRLSGYGGELPNVMFEDSVRESPESLARTVSLLATAEAVSTETRVRMVHPDWTEPAVAAEVQRILDETGRSLPDLGAYPVPDTDVEE